MSWTDQHQTEDAADDDQILSEEFDDWVREGAVPGVEEAEDESEAVQTDTTADGADSTAEEAEACSGGDQVEAASTSSSVYPPEGCGGGQNLASASEVIDRTADDSAVQPQRTVAM